MTSEHSIARLASLEHPSVVMMVGVPRSGKSYIAEQLGSLLDITVVSSDACREELSGDANDQTVSEGAWALVYDRAQALVDAGQSVIVDGTHKDKLRRHEDAQWYRDIGTRSVLAVWVDVPIATALARNATRERVVPEHVINDMYTALAKTHRN